MGAANVVAHCDKAELLAAAVPVVHFLAFGLLGILNDDSVVMTEIIHVFRHTVDLDVRRTHEGHDMKPSDLDSFQVGILGFRQLHGDVGFKTKYVSGAHFAFQIHQQTRIDSLEFDQPWRDPKGAQPFSDGKTDLAA